MSFVFRALRQQLRDHPDLYPLASALGVVSVVGIYAMWQALWKNDVEINRWHNKPLHETVRFDKPEEILFVTKADKANFYKDDPILKELLNEIYTKDRYLRKEVKH